ncbi:hypothetical protein NX059_011983 [Plenodomus lindquistii]|nr:hypothetical protein NX059_011983 [Plenodomus lindquistii]
MTVMKSRRAERLRSKLSVQLRSVFHKQKANVDGSENHTSSPLANLTALDDDAIKPPQVSTTTSMPLTNENVSLQGLPTELLIEICTHVDRPTLWLSCRAVSRQMQAIAEDVAKRCLLSKLQFQWYNNGPCPSLGATTPVPHGSCQTRILKSGRLLHYSEDDERAHFAVEAYPVHQVALIPRLKLRFVFLASKLEDEKHRHEGTLSQKVAVMDQPRYRHQMCPAYLPAFEVDIEAGQMSFLWKLFLTDFLDEKRCQYARDPLEP